MNGISMRLHKDFASFLIVAVVVMAAFYAFPAFALSYMDGGNLVTCPVNDWLVYTVVNCLQTAITAATITFLAAFSDVMYEPILALITLQVTLFGVQAAMGVAEIEKKAWALVIKIGVVLLFGQNLGGFAPDVFAIMEELIGTLLGIVGTGNIQCDAIGAVGAAFASDLVWVKIDCLLDVLFKWGDPGQLFNGIFAFSSASLFSGSIGVMVFMMTLLALLNMLFFCFYAAYIYILSVIFVGFLIVMSPLLFPLLLVGVSVSVFERWLQNLLAGMAIPVFVVLFLVLMMPLLDDVITDNQESITQVLGPDYTNWYRNSQQWCSQQVGTDYDGYKTDNYMNIPDRTIDHVLGPLKNILTPMMSGNTDYCAPVSTNSVDFYDKQVETLMDISDSMILLLVTAYLLTALMKQMATLGASIFNGGFMIAGLGQEGMFFESALRGGAHKGNSSIGMVGGNKSGLGFVSNGVSGVK